MKDKEQLEAIAKEVAETFYAGHVHRAVAILEKLQQWANNKGYIQGLDESRGKEWHDTE